MYPKLLSLAAITSLTSMASPAFAQTAQQQARFDQLVGLYADAGTIGTPEMVDCTLSGCEQTLCISITTGPAPSNHTTGPLLLPHHRHAP